jgi:two-component system phosphate regulon sensor histidine kinase PhoR
MKSNTFARLYAVLSIFVLIVFFINYYFTIKTFREHSIKSSHEYLFKTIVKIKPGILNLYNNPSGLEKTLKSLSAVCNCRLKVIDFHGNVVADSENDQETIEPYKNRPEIIEAEKTGSGYSVRYSVSTSQEMIYTAVESGHEHRSFIQASMPLASMSDFLNIYKKNIFFVAVILVSLSFSGTFLLTRSFADPLVKLAHASSLIASGNFDVVVPEIKKGELADLANNFKIMTGEIRKLFLNISRQKEELSNIIDAVNDFLIIVKFTGEISSASKKFEEFIRLDEISGKNYQDVIANKEIAKAIEKTLAGKKTFIKEFEIGEKTYLCTSAILPDLQEAVIVLRDISELKNLENFKRDLIANASHELRTPLTAIKGYIETLKDEKIGPGEKYLNIIERHTDRLIFIVQDLLILSRLEDKNIKPEFEQVSLNEIIADVALLLQKKALHKSLKLEVFSESDVAVSGERNLLVQLFLNLIDNAIKYTEKGSVGVTIKNLNGSVLIKIKDTGIGIDQKHLPRIFERFYVVDSSRSRSQGGTGLGLSIVKHIINKHNGNIEIKSALGKGTEIIIKLPTVL